MIPKVTRNNRYLIVNKVLVFFIFAVAENGIPAKIVLVFKNLSTDQK